MLNYLKQLLSDNEVIEEPASEEQTKIATCVVLLEAAFADDEFTDDEKEQIVSILKNRYGMDTKDSLELIESSIEMRDETIDVWQFTHKINQGMTMEEKVAVVEEVWRVVAADGGIHGKETYWVRQLANLFNMPHHNMIEAKVRALNEIRGNSG
jgi:uncharacterized tellurite resistance protein B-like protein